jgi:hypothetical protein
MELDKKLDELLLLITGYLEGRVLCNELKSFAWNIIDYFTDTPKNQLPVEETFEKAFWNAIWTIQHLCDDDHERDGITKRELTEVLKYLKKEKEFPDDYIGRRP